MFTLIESLWYSILGLVVSRIGLALSMLIYVWTLMPYRSCLFFNRTAPLTILIISSIPNL